MGDMQMNNFLMPPFLSLLPVTHFSSCFFSVLLCSPPSPLPFLLPLLFCILYPAIFPLWMVWWKRLALRDCTEAKPQLILLPRGMAVLSGNCPLICGISNGFLFFFASWSSNFSSPNLKIQIQILREIVFSTDRALPPQKKDCSWNTFVASTNPRYLCFLPCPTY